MKTVVKSLLLVLLVGTVLALSGCGNCGYRGYGGSHSHYNGCGHQGY